MIAATKPVTSRSLPIRTLVVHGDETLYRRNGLRGKLEARGLTVTRELLVDDVRTPASFRDVDVVVAIADTITNRGRALPWLRDACKTANLPIFAVPHQVSDPTWTAITDHVAANAVRVPGLATLTAEGALVAIGGKKRTIADAVAETEELAAMYQREADALRDRVTALEAELQATKTEARQAAERAKGEMEAAIERVDAERKEAVRALHVARADLEARLEAAEREGREAAGDGPRAAATLEKVRVLVRAVDLGALETAEAFAKIRAVLA